MATAVEKNAGIIVWVDFMKCGVVSANELNNHIETVKRALDLAPTRSCCFMIAPQCASDRRSGLRAEHRWGTIDVVVLGVGSSEKSNRQASTQRGRFPKPEQVCPHTPSDGCENLRA